MKDRLIAAGIPSQTLEAAESVGFSVDRILELLVKYGPVFLDILKELLRK